ncbi:MAG TPA: SDR family NAD(P)-dependent oxidoreductase [Actinomycetales bacterium]|nr:SDR family NAD(P)-dependent oxidoreductase [Actinomycetales bacterium]
MSTIDPTDLETCLRVLDEVGGLPADDPDSVTVQRAVGRMFKYLKKARRAEVRRARQEADKAVIEATATGSPTRIDDETAGIRLVSNAPGAVAGHLQRAQACYVCKELYTQVDAFYHQLCPACAAVNRAKRDPEMDLRGRRVLLTGGRAKIGMYIGLMLLRAGADVTITTRFPRDAVRRFASMDDYTDWADRVHVIGVDLRDPAQVVALADEVAAAGPLDILINNAAQTVRRSPGSYSGLVEGESAPITGRAAEVPMVTMGRTSELHPAALMGGESALIGADEAEREADHIAQLALQAGSASLDRVAAGTAIDAGGLLPDVVDHNSWVATVEQVEPMEMLEVQLCNSVAPFILVSRLRPALAASGARRKYVVNVSAMEGQFSRRYKGAGHPHTNMAKAGLNMLTRTSAEEMFTEHGILMTAVDTGWITDERPHVTKVRLHEEGFHAPLDLVDGAARVVDPIVRGEAGEDLYGCFLKDFEPSPW